MAKELLAAFDWSCKLLVHGFKDASNCAGLAFQKLVEAQSCLYTSILASKCKKMSKKAHHRCELKYFVENFKIILKILFLDWFKAGKKFLDQKPNIGQLCVNLKHLSSLWCSAVLS
jgi:hypothetical protein